MSDAVPTVPALKPSLRAVQGVATEQRREKQALRRKTLLELIYGYDQVATKLNLSVAAVRREVDRALAARDIDAPQRYIGLQLSRLDKAPLVVDLAMADRDLRSIPALIKVMGEVDRYTGFAARFKSHHISVDIAAESIAALENSEPPKVAENGA